MKIITESQCTGYSRPNHLETPERVSRTADHLRAQTDLNLTWAGPADIEDSVILSAHDESLLHRLDQPADYDADTPYFAGVAQYARRSAGGAIAALDWTCSGDPGFSLMRPPGHHASRFMPMGFCYLNSIAIAAMEARRRGFKSVAVFDFDVHHGNGTEDILLDAPGFAFASVHQTGYPFTGKAHRGTNCFNYLTEAGVPREAYRIALAGALEQLMKLKPDILAVSAGFDAYYADPLSEEKLEIEDYHWLGRTIRALAIPVFGILEGGYSPVLPELVAAYLRGLEGIPFKPRVPTPAQP